MNQRRNYIKRNLYKAAIVVFLLVALPVSSASSIGGYFIPGGMYGGESGYHYWENYCPLCHHYGCLVVNPKGTYEGEITCSRCDADYDGCSGYDKSAYGARARLTPAQVEEEPETNEIEKTNTQNDTSTIEKAANSTQNSTTNADSTNLTLKSLIKAKEPEKTVTMEWGVDNVTVNKTILQFHLDKIGEHWLL